MDLINEVNAVNDRDRDSRLGTYDHHCDQDCDI